MKIAKPRRHAGSPNLPEVPLRHWVLTFPFSWRRRLAHDGALLGALSRLFVETVLGFYAERAGMRAKRAELSARTPFFRLRSTDGALRFRSRA